MTRAWLATSSGLREYDGYQWRRHGVAEGLPSEFVRCVAVTRGGRLWVGTDRGAGIYDRTGFRSFGSETNLAGPSVRRIVEDPDGTVWFCSDPWPSSARSGGLTAWRDGRWRRYGVAEGLPSEYVVNYFRDSDGRQWVVTPDGLARWMGDRWETVLRPDRPGASFASGCVVEVPGQPVMFSTGKELYKLEGNQWRPLADVPNHQYGVAATADGRLFASILAGEGRRAIAEWSGEAWVQRSAEYEIFGGYSEDVQEDPDGNIWVVGHETAKLWRRHGQWHRFKGVPPPKFVDGSGRVWFARNSSRTLPAGPPVRSAGDRLERLESSYEDLGVDGAGVVWGWNPKGVTRWLGNSARTFSFHDLGMEAIAQGQADHPSGYWVAGWTTGRELTVAHFVDGRWNAYSVPRRETNRVIGLAPVGTARGWCCAPRTMRVTRFG